MLTGKDIDLYFAQKADVAYSGYLDPAKKNRLFKNAMFVCTDRKYLTLEEQKTFDEIAALITTNVVKTVNNNKIFTAPIAITGATYIGGRVMVKTYYPHNVIIGQSVRFNLVGGIVVTPDLNTNAFIVDTIVDEFSFTVPATSATGAYTAGSGNVVHDRLIADYMHLYSVKCRYVEPQFMKVVSTTGSSPINVFFREKTKFRDGSQIQLSSMTSTPNANGLWYTKMLGKNGLALYSDPDLQNPSTGGVKSDTAQGIVNYIWYEPAKPRFADRDIDPFEDAMVELPKFQVSEKFLKFFPDNRVCNEISISYIKRPSIFIDVNDNTLDLSLFYPEKYLYFIIDVIIRLFATPLRDTLLTQEIQNEILQNP